MTKKINAALVIETLAKLIVQGKRSMMEGPNYGTCAYRGAGGSMCAVGQHIPHDMYTEDMETNGFASLIEGWQNKQWNLPKVITLKSNRETLTRLQSFHDDAENWANLATFTASVKSLIHFLDLDYPHDDLQHAIAVTSNNANDEYYSFEYLIKKYWKGPVDAAA